MYVLVQMSSRITRRRDWKLKRADCTGLAGCVLKAGSGGATIVVSFALSIDALSSRSAKLLGVQEVLQIRYAGCFPWLMQVLAFVAFLLAPAPLFR